MGFLVLDHASWTLLPRRLGFNIELKYPTSLELAAMRADWWGRNHFVDAVLKVPGRDSGWLCMGDVSLRTFVRVGCLQRWLIFAMCAQTTTKSQRSPLCGLATSLVVTKGTASLLALSAIPLQVVLEEGAGRRVIFSTFDPDCATLLSLKQPRFPVLFLTCGGTKPFADPRMNSLEAALHFALASQLQVGGRDSEACLSACFANLDRTYE
jgi:hypothetical protein